MNNDQVMDRATSRFLHSLSTQNDTWQQSARGYMNVEEMGVRAVEASDAPFDGERARRVADSWGFELLDRVKISSRYYWKVRRTDAPEVDIIGGPSRELVRANPKARELAARVLQETGVNVLDPDECLRVEEAAGKQQASSVNGGWATSCMGALALLLGGLGGLLFQYVLPIAVLLILLALVSLVASVRAGRKGLRERKKFREEGHIEKAEAIRRVVRVAEKELLEGWRPDGLRGS